MTKLFYTFACLSALAAATPALAYHPARTLPRHARDFEAIAPRAMPQETTKAMSPSEERDPNDTLTGGPSGGLF